MSVVIVVKKSKIYEKEFEFEVGTESEALTLINEMIYNNEIPKDFEFYRDKYEIIDIIST